jgi:tRNA-dihydrouridine synthase
MALVAADTAVRERCDIGAELERRQRAIQQDEDGGAGARPLTVQAPMVRCSRASFRRTCQLWGTDVVYTHMFMAESIGRSAEAREAEVSFIEGERNIVAQIAAKEPADAAAAAVELAPFVDAIDINCGCPQRWAIAEGIGSALMHSPQVVSDVVKAVWRTANVPCVVKTRVFEDAARSVDWARQQEAAGARWVTIHGRLSTDPPSHPVRWETVRTIQESLSVPTVLNGGVDSASLGLELARKTGCGGVMSARELLANPAMFAGYESVPPACFRDYMRLAAAFDTRMEVVRLHVGHMLERHLAPAERSILASQASFPALIETLRGTGWLD